MDKTTIYLVRHGQTEENTAHILQGHMPGTLTPLGEEQARQLRDRLKGETFDVLLCSDLRRCVKTAEIINGAMGMQIIQTPLLRERDWGSITGQTVEWLHSHSIPADAETVEQMMQRAARFISLVRDSYPGQRVLAVSHGLFGRAIQAVLCGKEIKDIPRMENAGVCLLEV